MADTALIELIVYGREERSLEYKGSVGWDQAEMKAKITRTILALSNIRDGGSIVIGVEQRGQVFTPVGVSGTNLISFKQDDISEYVNEFADPFAEPRVSHVSHSGMDFVVVQVQEFSEIPVVCKKNGPATILRRGAIYTRPRRKIESVEVPSQVEMREILDSAIEKGFRNLLARLDRAGVSVTAGKIETGVGDRESVRRKFDQQLTGL